MDWERGRQTVRTSVARRNPENYRLDTALSSQQIEEVERIIDRLAEELRTRVSRRMKRARRGVLNLKSTIIGSANTGGLPLRLVYRRPRVRRHDLIVLCDVSGSVRRVAPLLLRLVHGMQNRLQTVRSFVFVDRPVEVSRDFARLPFPEAIARIEAGDLVDVHAYSDYGRMFTELYHRHLPLLSKRSVLLIFGDAWTNEFRRRSNGRWSP